MKVNKEVLTAWTIITFALMQLANPWVVRATEGGSSVGNGGGLAESNLAFARINLKRYMQLCLGVQFCELSSSERTLLERMVHSYGDELAANPDNQGLIFLSGEKHPEIFILDETGQPRTAVTGDGIGDPIYINLDRLYPIDPATGAPTPLSIPAAVSLLIHEFGHHIEGGEIGDDHGRLDQLGSKVRRVLLSQGEDTRLSRYQQDHIAVWISNNKLDLLDPEFNFDYRAQVVLSDGETLQDLSGQVAQSLPCPPGGRPDSFEVHGSRWGALPPWDSVSNTQVVIASADISYACKMPLFGGLEVPKLYEATLRVSVSVLPLGNLMGQGWWSFNKAYFVPNTARVSFGDVRRNYNLPDGLMPPPAHASVGETAVHGTGTEREWNVTLELDTFIPWNLTNCTGSFDMEAPSLNSRGIQVKMPFEQCEFASLGGTRWRVTLRQKVGGGPTRLYRLDQLQLKFSGRSDWEAASLGLPFSMEAQVVGGEAVAIEIVDGLHPSLENDALLVDLRVQPAHRVRKVRLGLILSTRDGRLQQGTLEFSAEEFPGLLPFEQVAGEREVNVRLRIPMDRNFDAYRWVAFSEVHLVLESLQTAQFKYDFPHLQAPRVYLGIR